MGEIKKKSADVFNTSLNAVHLETIYLQEQTVPEY